MDPESIISEQSSNLSPAENTGSVEALELPDSQTDMILQISRLEQKIRDGVELIHLWKNEAYAYRLLLERVLDGDYPISEARKAVSQGLVADDFLKVKARMEP